MASGLERARVAELIVTTRGGSRRRGSGYRVTADRVLTAGHVLDDAETVDVRFEPDLPGKWTARATGWTTAETDIGVLTFVPPAGEPIPPAALGEPGDDGAVLGIEAVGFPRWKTRVDPGGTRYRDSCHAIGTIALFSNWREGTLEVSLPNEPAPDPDVSPWEGMSGAAVWAGDVIVGVIAEHHAKDGLARLAAVPIPASVPGLPGDRRRVETPRVVASAYAAQLADIAPIHLQDRDTELDELISFCAGNEPYRWLQAGPWAGKSAVLAWFAGHPPAGVQVVSFFITSRFAGQSDSDAFTSALLEQLAELAGEEPHYVLNAPARQGHLLRLLTAVAERCVAAGRRLLLVVDGLDEDTSRTTDRPSVTSLLPRRLPPGLRVLVASRPHPGLADDVPGDHPLRMLTPVRLETSPHAHDVELAAKNELAKLLQGPSEHLRVLGLVTASGGGLTGRDLEELTGLPPYRLGYLFTGIFGRSIRTRISLGEDVYLFAHETLRELAESQFGGALNGFRAELHEWADNYRQQGWPSGTPAYLLRGYSRMLADIGDLDRLVGCATDRARHRRLAASSGGDQLTASEVAAARALLLGEEGPDLGVALRLSLAAQELSLRTSALPVRLPALWARLGERERADEMVRGIADLSHRVKAITRLMAVARQDRDRRHLIDLYSQGVRVAEQIYDRRRRAAALTDLFESLDDDERAGILTTPDERARWAEEAVAAEVVARHTGMSDQQLWSDTAVLWANASDFSRALSATDFLTGPLRVLTWATIAKRGIEADYQDPASNELLHRAADHAAGIGSPRDEARAFVALARTAATDGGTEPAARYLTRALHAFDRILDPGHRTDALGDVATALIDADRHAEVVAVVAELRQHSDDLPPLAVVELAAASGAAGDIVTAKTLIGEAESAVPATPQAATVLAAACFAAGEHTKAKEHAEIAEALARGAGRGHTDVLFDLAWPLAAAGDRTRALAALAAAERSPDEDGFTWPSHWDAVALACGEPRQPVPGVELTTRAKVLFDIAALAARLGRQNHAQELAIAALGTGALSGTRWLRERSPIAWAPEMLPRVANAPRPSDPFTDVRELAARVRILAAAGHRGIAAELADEMGGIAGRLWDRYEPSAHTQALAVAAEAFARLGNGGRATQLASAAEETMARGGGSPYDLRAVAVAWGWAGRLDRASLHLQKVARPLVGASTYRSLVEALHTIGRATEAQITFETGINAVRALEDLEARCAELRLLAVTAAHIDQPSRCRELLDYAETTAHRIPDLETRCGSLGDVAGAILLVGMDRPPHARSRRLLAQALTGRWRMTITAIAQVSLCELQRGFDQIIEGLG